MERRCWAISPHWLEKNIQWRKAAFKHLDKVNGICEGDKLTFSKSTQLQKGLIVLN